MGSWFLPPETHGTWDAREKVLTVFVGDRASVGFQGTAAEAQAVRFSAWSQTLGECTSEVYNESATRRGANIITANVGTVQFEATDGMKPLAPPLTVRIEKRADNRTAQPEGQLDETACWAACLTFWTRITPGIKEIPQLELIGKGAGLWSSDGTILPERLQELVRKLQIGMNFRTVNPRDLKAQMGLFPMLLGFTASGGFGHMNVVVGYDATFNTVDVMEPMYPDPIFNDNFEAINGGNNLPLFVEKGTGAPFRYTGAVRTGLSFEWFATQPMKQGTFWIGYPARYASRM